MKCWCWIGLVLLLWGGVSITQAQTTNTPAATIEGLIRQIGADDYRTRNSAEEQLGKIGTPAIPFLKKLENSRDPEIKMRACRLLGKLSVVNNRAFFERGGKCQGYADGDGRHWPCVFEVTKFDPKTGSFTGRVEWTSLNALHAIEGKLEADRLQFRETKFIRQGNAILNCVYTLDLTPPDPKVPGVIRGQWENPDDSRSGNVELDLSSSPK